jgi:restriction system protein
VRDFGALNRLGWREFERLAASHLQRLGYKVRLHGGSGGDGGIDLIASRRGQRYIVQCKHWRGKRVGVRIVREMFGVMHAEKADGVVIVSSGRFTREAQAFADQNRIVLINGRDLIGSLCGKAPIRLGRAESSRR